MILIPILLLAMIVMLAGLFMLAKAKKEQLGRTYVIASTVAAGFGVLVFVFGITAGILMCCHKACGKGNQKCGSEMSCPMMHGGGGGMGNCSMMMNPHGECSGMGGGCEGGKGKFQMKVMGGKCEMMDMEDANEVKDVIIKKLGEGENGAEVKVEIEKKTK